jgi:hypothetical protein
MKVQDMNFGHLANPVNGITNVETIAVTSFPVIMPNVTAHILVSGSLEISNGAGAATITIRLRRGPLITDLPVFISQGLNIVATGQLAIPFHFEEDLANAAGVQYTVTVTNSVNQANNNIATADIQVVVL